MSFMDIQHGYHVWVSIISMISRKTYLNERVDEDYVSYPEVKYFHDELNECEQSLMVALNDLDTSQRRVEQLESSI